MTFMDYIWCFLHNFIWPCDLDLRPFDHGGVWRIKSLTHQTHIPIFSTLWLSIPELCVTQSYHITIIWNGHCACAVSRDLCIGHKTTKPHVAIFWPRLIYSLYNFYGATMTIKGSLYRSISMLKRFRLLKNSSQNQFQKWRFSEI